MKESTEIRSYNKHDIAVYLHDTGLKNIVIFCHGYRGDSTGPNRFFVRTARMFAEKGISSIRFDQYGSGNSTGDFLESRFNDWVATTQAIARNYLEQGYKVSLFGQSMGGSTVVAVTAQIPELTAVVAWVPDASIDEFVWPEEGFIEEAGQRVSPVFWQEAHSANIANQYRQIEVPMYIVQCTADEYVSEQNRQVFVKGAKPQHIVDTYEGYSHSSWTYDQASEIIKKSVDFLDHTFKD
ncbi:MAG TPA: alpha/beta hydrolase [Candidatus Saccharibacteria bacterium]|nr:alpha/beta hydrolase [Candidatus Saccharibacteria bacterium]